MSPGSPTTPVKQPKYQQILDHLHVEIVSGRLAPGAALPTEAELCRSLDSSRGTVRQALGALENHGLIHRIQGKGTYVSTDQQRRAGKQLDQFALISLRLSESFYPSLVEGFEQASSKLHQQVVVGNSSNDVDRQGNLILQMIDRGVGGVAIAPVTTATTPVFQIRQLQKHNIPVVFCHRAVPGVSAPLVTWDGREVGRRAGAILAELGHSRICFLFSHRQPKVAEYEAGLNQVLEEHFAGNGMFISKPYDTLAKGSLSVAIRKSLEENFSRPDRSTAIFCGNLPDAEQVYLQASDFGLRVPQDLSILYFGGMDRGHGLAERMSCIAIDECALGAQAAQMLHEMRSGQRPIESDEQVIFPIQDLPGETIGPASS